MARALKPPVFGVAVSACCNCDLKVASQGLVDSTLMQVGSVHGLVGLIGRVADSMQGLAVRTSIS